jgi:hypothetical protein
MADFYLCCDGVHVKDALIARRQKLLLFGEFEDGDVGLEFGRFLAVVEVVADHVASANVVFVDVLYTHLYVLAGTREPHLFILCVKDLPDDHLDPLREDGDCLVFNYGARFNFAVHIELSQIFEFVDNGDSQRSHGLPLRKHQVVEVLSEGRSLVPGVRDSCMDVLVLE